MGRAAEVVAPSSSIRTDGDRPVAQVNDLSRSLTHTQQGIVDFQIAVILDETELPKMPTRERVVPTISASCLADLS